MKRNLMISFVLFLISIPFVIFHLWIISLLFLGFSFFFFVKGILHNINILNEECNPIEFFKQNSEKKGQEMNCCFALLHSYSDEKKELFEEYLDKAEQKKWKSNLYQMKLDYLTLNFHYLNQEIDDKETEAFEENWTNNKYLNFLEQKMIHKFLDNKHYKSMLSSVVGHFEKAVNFYETENYDLSASEFQYVKKYGGTTIYARLANEYLENQLKDIKIMNEIKKDSIHLKEKYYLNKNLIDTYFCIYLLLFILMMTFGGKIL